VYVWESERAPARFRESDLAKSIPVAYDVDGGARSEVADVVLVVREGTADVSAGGDVAAR
jgi:hypothetical protein